MDLLLKLDQPGAKKMIRLKLEIDPKSHPAWTGGKANINESEGQVARFQKRFKGLKV
jgi:ribosomal protein L31